MADADPNANRILIFDTTLRDGEQSPGASMNHGREGRGRPGPRGARRRRDRGRLPDRLARRLRGRPRHRHRGRRRHRSAASPAATTATSTAPGRPSSTPRSPRIHVFLATSAIHREHKLKMTRAQVIERAVASVRRAKGYCADVEFSPEDAARTEIDFLCEVVEAAIEAGATTVNIPDTVGYATPTQYAGVIRTLRERVPNIGRAVISVHCHDDLGLAVANSLAACEAGARQVECTINGIGERAGNAALEEIVMALKTRLRLLRPDHRHQDRAALPGQPDGLDDHRHGRPAEQGDRRPQRLRPRVGHPPGRHAQGAVDLRDHAARGRRRPQDRPRPGQALRPPRPPRPRRRAGLPPQRRAARDRSSTTSRPWPTRRRRSTTRTWSS